MSLVRQVRCMASLAVVLLACGHLSHMGPFMSLIRQVASHRSAALSMDRSGALFRDALFMGLIWARFPWASCTLTLVTARAPACLMNSVVEHCCHAAGEYLSHI